VEETTFVDLRTELTNTERDSLVASGTSLKMSSLSIGGWYIRNHASLCAGTAILNCSKWTTASVVTIWLSFRVHRPGNAAGTVRATRAGVPGEIRT
jgi:hypothetical protein